MSGFVYIWYDRKHKRYYVGSHWGPEDDGYVCSSVWMRRAYRHRPQDFKRRIVARVFTSRQDLFDEEYRWLKMMKPEEMRGPRYYNIKTYRDNHWHAEDETIRLSVREKISASKKKFFAANPDHAKRIRNSWSPEVQSAATQKSVATMRDRHWNNPESNLRDRISSSVTELWKDDEYRSSLEAIHRELWKDPKHREMMAKARDTEKFKKNSADNGRKSAEKRRGQKRSPETVEKMRAALSGKKRPNMTGENNVMFRGYYVTPWGKFPTLREAEERSPVTGQTLKVWCNRDVILGSYSITRHRLPESWKGKTTTEIGFGFQPR